MEFSIIKSRLRRANKRKSEAERLAALAKCSRQLERLILSLKVVMIGCKVGLWPYHIRFDQVAQKRLLNIEAEWQNDPEAAWEVLHLIARAGAKDRVAVEYVFAQLRPAPQRNATWPPRGAKPLEPVLTPLAAPDAVKTKLTRRQFLLNRERADAARDFDPERPDCHSPMLSENDHPARAEGSRSARNQSFRRWPGPLLAFKSLALPWFR
jgi:hypothetical protein